ncbi:Uncharacterized ACR, COG1399 [Salinihabitans flavidus]|uniref:Uncharacterized ACR, COG1399 n=1 Tax=Salinihabitans flavidus TaxID=569882 RepID=A0A1H8PQC9_9RHOB|nr:DUF177 domain-containing protein [Salinihabitans flavidus]SEO43898.1 Uncharacterized ACR, COG1399 [Salinihabitans flavidus]
MTGISPQDSVFRVSKLPQNGATAFALRPGAEAMKALAEELGLLSLRKLSFQGEISALGDRDWQLLGKLGATVVQPCVVTLDPVTTRIDVDVERRFVADMELPDTEEEVEMPEDENAEPLRATIDVAAVMAEALALNLPLYPRAGEAELGEAVFTRPGKSPMRDEDVRPFSGLAGLRDKLDDSEDK